MIAALFNLINSIDASLFAGINAGHTQELRIAQFKDGAPVKLQYDPMTCILTVVAAIENVHQDHLNILNPQPPLEAARRCKN